MSPSWVRLWSTILIYVNLSTVGYSSDGSNSVQCHTDLSTCCSCSQGPHRGDWYFPDGERLPLLGEMLYERRGPQRVDLRRASGNGPTSNIAVIFQLMLSMMMVMLIS